MRRLHFHPIKGKAIDIINAILHTEEVALLSDNVLKDIYLVVEELVVNIVDYAYPEGIDDYLDVEVIRDEKQITLRFIDGGVPFNPLESKTPDISLPMSERKMGGLGIFLVKYTMDKIAYEYINGENVLTVSTSV